jgi:hypothetical protein
MTSYDTPYNRQLARTQRLYDYSDINQDRADILDNGPLNGGSLPADIGLQGGQADPMGGCLLQE